jgi:PAS domain S-box-containing protein
LAFVGWYAGLGPAVVSLVLGAAGVWYFVLPPTFSWTLADPRFIAGLVVYLIAGAGSGLLGDAVRRALWRAQELLRAKRESDEQLASLFNVTNVGMAQADPMTRRFLRANEAMCALTGYSEAELLTMTVDELNHPDDRERDRELFERLARGESAYEVEKRYVCKDGRTVWVQVTANLLRGEDGRQIRSFAVIQNITSRKQAEAQRTEAIARLDALLDHAPIGVALFDSDLRFIALNDTVSAIDGIPKEEHLGRTLPELLPQLGPRVEAGLRRVRETGEPVLEVELGGETPATPGVEHHWTTNYFPVTEGSGRLLGIGAMALDVTERVRAERALRDSEQRFATLADSTPVMIWVTDPQGNVQFVNRSYREFFNVREEQVTGPTAWQPLVHPDDVPMLVERFGKAVRDREEFVAECRVRHRDGTWRWIMSRGTPRFAADGAFLGHVGSSPDITTRKRAEEALRLKEAHLELLSDSLPALIAYIGRDRCYHSCNRAYTTVLGLPCDNVIGRPVRDVTGEEVWAIVGPRLEAAFSGDSVDFETQTRFPDGSLRWIHAAYTPHRNDRGDVIGVIAMTTDVTTAKLAEQALRATEERFRIFMDHSPALAWLKDEHGRYVFANRSTLAALGLTAADLVGKSDADVMPPAQAEQCRSNDLSVLKTGAAAEMTETWQEADGEHHVLSVKFPIDVADGHRYVGGMALDITRQKHAEQAVIESEQRFRTMAEVSPVMIWVTGPDGAIEFVNRAYREFFGVTDDQVRADAWQQFAHPEDVSTYVEAAMTAVREHTPFAGECRVRHADGSWRWIGTYAAPRFSLSGEFLGHVGSSPDITELKRAEQTLKDADRRKDEFLAILGHELRNPLAPVRTGLELLRRTGDAPETIGRVRPMMERQVMHIVRLVDDLLDISRITSGKIHLQPKPIPIAELVHHAVEANRGAIEAAGLELSLDVPDTPCLIDVDPTRFVQVLSNLLHNATKFTDPGGQIAITAKVDDDASAPSAVVTVRDTGVGIPAATLPHVFDLFVQGESGARGKSGLGIGLALSHRLIAMQGGRIDVHSDGPDQGTIFTIRMPLLSRPARAGMREPHESTGSTSPV